MNMNINMIKIKKKFDTLCNTKSDINEHLITLSNYASKCNSVTEFGVRSCVSTYAFIHSLLSDNDNNYNISLSKSYTGVDIKKHDNIIEIENICNENNINFSFIEDNDLNIKIENTDLLFIDSWHCYGQLIRELELHHKNVNKYIIIHDTSIDEFNSEIVRIPGRWSKPNYFEIIKKSGFNKYELTTGLWPAVINFLKLNKEWKFKERFTNNNGLTILEKI